MKKVMIALDYNPCAQKVAEAGFEYARAMNAKLCIVHAIADVASYTMEYSPVMGFESFSPDCSFGEPEEQQREAGRFLQSVVRHLGDEQIKIKVLDGRTADTILKYAAEYQADLLVMGSQSHNGIEKWILGNVVAKVLNKTVIPLLIVPTGEPDLAKIARKVEAFQWF
jgi:nucleotide-binding universal stress UspA family protein